MTSLAAPRVAGEVAACTSDRKPAFASARAALRRSFRGFAIAADLERNRPLSDPYVIMGLIRD
jgi:hypothetical protein